MGGTCHTKEKVCALMPDQLSSLSACLELAKKVIFSLLVSYTLDNHQLSPPLRRALSYLELPEGSFSHQPITG